MAVNAAIGLSGEDRHNCSFTLSAKATSLNKHGAAIQIHRELSVGSTVRVRNKRGIQASARVVAQVIAIDGVRTYGIEFVEEDELVKTFWGISFPTA
jgi:hypothetical protein